MHLDFFRIDIIYILCILTGTFFILCAVVNPRKIIIGNLTESNFIDKQKFIFYTRILVLFIGLIMLTISLLFWLNIVSRKDLGSIFGIPLLIMIIGNSIIAKKYLVRKVEITNKDVEVTFCYYCGNKLNRNIICPSCGKKIELY